MKLSRDSTATVGAPTELLELCVLGTVLDSYRTGSTLNLPVWVFVYKFRFACNASHTHSCSRAPICASTTEAARVSSALVFCLSESV